MASGLQHIDDFFRTKNEDHSVDLSSADLHWDQMKTVLSTDLSLPAPKRRTLIFRRWLKYAAIVTAVSGLIYVNYTAEHGKTKTNKRSPGVIVNNPAPPKPENYATAPIVRFRETATALTSSKKITVRKAVSKFVAPLIPVKDSGNTTIPIMTDAVAFDNFYTELKKQPEQFIIDTKKDTTIHCKEGSSLFIPASCFQSLTGVAISGTVEVYVQEFYSIADIIGNKLSTLSNGRTLVTGGMLNIEALTGSQQLEIRPGMAIQLSMPTKTFDPTMQLFTAARETTKRTKVRDTLAGQSTAGRLYRSVQGINWIDGGQDQFFMRENKRFVPVMNLMDNPYDVVYHGTRKIGKFRIPFNCPLSSDQMRQELESRFGHMYDRIKVKRQWKPWFKNKRDLRTGWVQFSYDGPVVGDTVSLPLWYARKRNLISVEDSLAYETKWRKEFEDAKAKQQPYAEFLQIKDSYNFRISNLGWINCDRFANYRGSQLTTFNVVTENEFKETYFQAMLVLDRENSAIPGDWQNGTIHFWGQLPIGEKVNVICVGAKQGKVYAAVQKFTVGSGSSNKLQFAETTPAEFKDALSRFGHVVSGN